MRDEGELFFVAIVLALLLAAVVRKTGGIL